jgi:hypothetical protein
VEHEISVKFKRKLIVTRTHDRGASAVHAAACPYRHEHSRTPHRNSSSALRKVNKHRRQYAVFRSKHWAGFTGVKSPETLRGGGASYWSPARQQVSARAAVQTGYTFLFRTPILRPSHCTELRYAMLSVPPSEDSHGQL